MNPKASDAPPQLSVKYLLQELPLPSPSVLQQAVRYEAMPKLSTGKECLHLRGLPVDAQPETIMQFLGPDALSVIPEGVHIMYTPEGQPSGEAIIQMNSEESAFWAVVNSHDRCMMGPRRKPSRIEALLCSVTEMKTMLAKTLPGPISPSGGTREPQREPNHPGRPPVLTPRPAMMAPTAATMPPTFVPRGVPWSAPRPAVPLETLSPYKVTWLLVRDLPESATDSDITAFFDSTLGLKTGGVYLVHQADFSLSAVVGVQCPPATLQAVLNCRQCHYIGNRRIDLRIVDAEYVSRWLTTPPRALVCNLPEPVKKFP
ncbi:hypothetical protein HPB48_025415 [Haemaphysalis longicornis]|uniref:RRM domain-containing protein n=1 Tax=Haemaphysalis longicornis TaxID=44386 RepID=A0A9J6GYZ4_HAELO|nr:hypothetical protein HPB48_025415 [Haemaphysalis longicornis]